MSLEKVEKHMSKDPFQIHPATPAVEALKIMETHGIRHLPVVKNVKAERGKIIGVISERDLRRVVHADDGNEILVWALMSRNPYVVKENEPVENVIREMRKHKYGCAIVIDQFYWITGIFTTIDALALLEKLLENQGSQPRASFGAIEEYLAFNSERPANLPA